MCLTILLLKYVFRLELNERLEELLELLGELSEQRDSLAFLKTVLTYLAAGAERLDEGHPITHKSQPLVT